MQERAGRSVNIGDDSLPGLWSLVSPSAPNRGNPIKPGGLTDSRSEPFLNIHLSAVPTPALNRLQASRRLGRVSSSKRPCEAKSLWYARIDANHSTFGSYPTSAIEVEWFQMQQVAVGVGGTESPIHLIFRGLLLSAHRKEEDRGARRNVSQEAAGVESAYGYESGGDRAVHDRLHRPTGTSVAALWGLPTALPEGAQCAQTTGMARPVDAESTVETALPALSGRMPPVRSAGGGFSPGRTLGRE
jgi:hypothetical protein